MAEVAPEPLTTEYRLMIKYQDILGWQNFIEGRFLTFMVQLQRHHLQGCDTWRTSESWAHGLMEQLLCITHRQWLHRNALLHFRLSDGRTLVERAAIVERVMGLMWTDPSELLPADRPLLDQDFEKLGRADAGNQAYWASEVEAAIQWARHSRDR